MCTKDLCFLLQKREFGGDVAVFYNAVLIPKSKNMAKSMAAFSKTPAILFAMFLRGFHLASTWRRCLSVFQDRDKNMAFFYEKVHHPPYE